MPGRRNPRKARHRAVFPIHSQLCQNFLESMSHMLPPPSCRFLQNSPPSQSHSSSFSQKPLLALPAFSELMTGNTGQLSPASSWSHPPLQEEACDIHCGIPLLSSCPLTSTLTPSVPGLKTSGVCPPDRGALGTTSNPQPEKPAGEKQAGAWLCSS